MIWITLKCCPYRFSNKMLSAFYFYEMRTTFSCCAYHPLQEMLSTFLFLKCRQHFHVVRIIFRKFFWWNADNFRLSAFSKSYRHQYLENKCCPHFLLMKCGQHSKLSACCPVIRSCPHFINTRFIGFVNWILEILYRYLYHTKAEFSSTM